MKRRMAALLGGMVVLAAAAAFAQCHRSDTVLHLGVFAGSYWGTPNGSSYQVLDDAIACFEAAHPGVTVEYESGIPVDEYSEWLAGHLLIGEEPDVFFVLPEDFGLLAETGALAPLDPLLDTPDGPERSLYYDACLQAGQYDGLQLALPYESAATVMFVNRPCWKSTTSPCLKTTGPGRTCIPSAKPSLMRSPMPPIGITAFTATLGRMRCMPTAACCFLPMGSSVICPTHGPWPPSSLPSSSAA